jgi:hypothetical protein
VNKGSGAAHQVELFAAVLPNKALDAALVNDLKRPVPVLLKAKVQAAVPRK